MGTLRLPNGGPKCPHLVAEGHQPSAGARSLAPVGGQTFQYVKKCDEGGQAQVAIKIMDTSIIIYEEQQLLAKSSVNKNSYTSRSNFYEFYRLEGLAPYGGQTSSSCRGLVAFSHQMGALWAPWLGKMKFGVLCPPPSSSFGGLMAFVHLIWDRVLQLALNNLTGRHCRR